MAPTSVDVGIASGALTSTNTGIAHELEVTLVAGLVSGPGRAVCPTRSPWRWVVARRLGAKRMWNRSDATSVILMGVNAELVTRRTLR